MKYEILKEFINPPSKTLMHPGDTLELRGYSDSESEVCYYEALEKHGFIKKIKDEPWGPKRGEAYWFIDDLGRVREDTYGGSFIDQCRSKIGDRFQTAKKAQKAAEWLKAFRVLREDTKGFKPDWSGNGCNYAVVYDAFNNELVVHIYQSTQPSIIYFANHEDAKESINKHEKEWRVFYGVEEDK